MNVISNEENVNTIKAGEAFSREIRKSLVVVLTNYNLFRK